MQRAEGLPQRGSLSGPTVVTIGVFDGMHRGHAALLSRVREQARALDAKSVVLTFGKHPDAVLRGAAPLPLLSLDERLALLDEFGIDACFALDFDAKLMGMSAADFADDVLRSALDCRTLVLGHDSAICKKREGTAERFRELGIDAERIERFERNDAIVSASAIRSALAAGDLETANDMLAREHRVHGVVVAGDGRGRTLGYPTANLEVNRACTPASGVYAVRVRAEAWSAPKHGVANLGVRPTFGDGPASFEVHVFDFDGDLYGAELRVDFVRRLREEKSFDGVDALRQQIEKDVADARASLAL